jgi:peroxiredoxin family protein
MNDRFAIVLFSGTADKLMAAANIAAGAAAGGHEVTVFLTFGGLLAFRKDEWKTNDRLSSDLGKYADLVRQAMQNPAMPSWMQVFRDAMEIGNLKITACLMTLELFGLKLEDLEPIVSEVSTVSNFLGTTEGGKPLFI